MPLSEQQYQEVDELSRELMTKLHSHSASVCLQALQASMMAVTSQLPLESQKIVVMDSARALEAMARDISEEEQLMAPSGTAH